MPKQKLLNGLPYNLAQSFFSTLRHWEKGYMSDWIVNSAIELNINKIKINIINRTTEPKGLEIKPVINHLNDLQKIIDKEVNHAGFPPGYINQAIFEIEVFEDRSLKCKTTITSTDDKIYTAKDYIEKSYEEFKTINRTHTDNFIRRVMKGYYKIRFRLLGRLAFGKIKHP